MNETSTQNRDDTTRPAGAPPIQAEVGAWLDEHLPGRSIELQALVLAEEVGELCRAVVKRQQGIRGTHAEWSAQLRAEAGDVLLTLYSLAASEGFDLHDAAARKWQQILRRDPTAHRPAHTEPAANPTRDTHAKAAAGRESGRAEAGEGQTWDEQVRAGVHAVFGNQTGETIVESEAFGALAYRLRQHLDQDGDTPADVLTALDEADHRFAGRANNPAAFLARKVAEL